MLERTGTKLATRRQALRIVGAIGLSLLAAGCGGQAAAPTGAPTSAPASLAAATQAPAQAAATSAAPAAAATTAPAAAPTTAAVAATAPGPAVKGATKLVVWAGSFSNIPSRLQAQSKDTGALFAKWVVDNFQQANPGVTIEAEDHGWSEALRTALLTAIAGGNVPEVTTGEAFVHEFARLGAFTTVTTPEKFAQGVAIESTYQGKLYGVPVYTSPFALETNVRVAKKAGLDPNDPPKDWNKLVENSVLAAKAGAGNYFGFNVYGAAPSLIYGTVLRAIPFVNQTGHPVGDDEGTKIMFNDKDAMPAYELARKLFKTADPGNSFSGDEGKIYSFLWQDKATYQVSATWNIFNALDKNAESVFHPLPTPAPGKTGNVPLGTEIFSPLAKSKVKETAAQFCAFLGDKATQKQVGEILGNRLPTNLALLTDPNLAQSAAYKERGTQQAIQTFMDILANENVRPIPPWSKNADKIWGAWSDAYAKVLQTDQPIQGIMDAAQAQAEKLL